MNVRTVIISSLATLLVLLLISAVGVVVAGPDDVPIGTQNNEYRSDEKAKNGPPDQLPAENPGIPGHVQERLNAINDFIVNLLDDLVEALKGTAEVQGPKFGTTGQTGGW